LGIFLSVNCAEEGSECFTLEVIHGGVFVGFGCNRAYINGKKVCYDNCDMDTWSALWLEDIIEDLGYEKAGWTFIGCCQGCKSMKMVFVL
jgi:hypothetical protein